MGLGDRAAVITACVSCSHVPRCRTRPTSARFPPWEHDPQTPARQLRRKAVAMTSDSPTSHRAVFGTWPTPLEPMPRLARAIGLGAGDLWVKRDDLTGLGGGGNKVRKLEWTCGAALADGATALVTTGAPQSNHARLTAAAGARLGLDVVLVLMRRTGILDVRQPRTRRSLRRHGRVGRGCR